MESERKQEDNEMKSKALVFLIAAALIFGTTAWAGYGSGGNGGSPQASLNAGSAQATPQGNGHGMRPGGNDGSAQSQGQSVRKRDGSCPNGDTPTQQRSRAKDGSGSGSKARRGGRT